MACPNRSRAAEYSDQDKIDVVINQDLKAIELHDEFNENYFYNFYLTQNIKGSGMTVSGIRQPELLNMLIPVPPANEQPALSPELISSCPYAISLKPDSCAHRCTARS